MENLTGVLIVLTILVILNFCLSVLNLVSMGYFVKWYKKHSVRNHHQILSMYNRITDVLREVDDFVFDYKKKERFNTLQNID